MKFKLGDWVKCISGHSDNRNKFITYNKSYRVTYSDNVSAHRFATISIINDIGEEVGYFIDRFELDIKKQRIEKLKQLNNEIIK